MVRTIVIAMGMATVLSGAAAAAEPLVPIGALKADIAKFRGKRVDVSGHMSVLGEVATLGIDGSDAHTILVDLGSLPPDQRRILTSRCNEGCDIRLSGRGGLVLRDPGVIAADLHLADDMPSRVASGAN